MPKTRDLFFIQIGANVGKNVGSGDPIWEYVRPCNWSGAAVELVPDTFLKLKTNYADMEALNRVVTLNHGVSDKSGYAKISGSGETASIGSIVADKNQTEGYGDGVAVEIVTISSLWSRLKDHIPSSGVDILVLDVEGNEGNILARENLPFPRPTRILFEIAHLSVKEKDEIDEKLRSQGYRQSADLIHRDRLGLAMPPQDRLYELMLEYATGDNSVCESSIFSPPEVPLFIKWEHFMPKTRDLFFIQIGANVGKNVGSGDPIWEYVRPCNWSGAAVELVPDTFLKLKTNYADMEALNRVVTLNHGVSDKSGYAKISGSGETASIGSIVADKNQTEGYGDGVAVEIVTISSLWSRLKDHIPSSGVDILVLDVEGNEGNILARENLPFPRPTRILFEIAHLSVKEKDEIDEKLRSQGYRQSADLIHRDRLGLAMPPQDRLYELIVDYHSIPPEVHHRLRL